jgi:hypothetical protein
MSRRAHRAPDAPQLTRVLQLDGERGLVQPRNPDARRIRHFEFVRHLDAGLGRRTPERSRGWNSRRFFHTDQIVPRRPTPREIRSAAHPCRPPNLPSLPQQQRHRAHGKHRQGAPSAPAPLPRNALLRRESREKADQRVREVRVRKQVGGHEARSARRVPKGSTRNGSVTRFDGARLDESLCPQAETPSG